MTLPTVVTFRIDNTTKSRVDVVAKELGHSRAWVIRRVLEDHIKDVRDIEIARRRMADPSDAVITVDEARTQL